MVGKGLTDHFSSRIPESTCVFPKDGKEQSSEGIRGNATLMLSWILGSHVLSRTLIHGYMFGGRKELHLQIFCVTKVIAVSVNSTGLEHTFEKLCSKPVSSVCQEGPDTLPVHNLSSPMTLKPNSTAEPGFSDDWSLSPAASFSWCHVAFILSKLPQFKVKNRTFTQKALLKAILCWALYDCWLWKDPTPPDQLHP